MGMFASSNRRHMTRRIGTAFLALMLIAGLAVHSLPAADIETYAFEKVWWRTDLPVEMNRVDRTWIWGPEPISSLLLEPYEEGRASGMDGARWVQYFDKTRVEITRPDQDRDEWQVTNGLLAKELITGRMQIGDASYVEYDPASINVAGDTDDADAPTYRSLSHVLDEPALEPGTIVTQSIARDGSIGVSPTASEHAVEALRPIDSVEHSIASVFWNFMTAEGVIYDGFDFVEGRLFEDPFFATGRPITEPYWATVRVGSEPREVLIQAFERRVLTYTPENPAGWTVEAANVGRHYYRWRYMDGPASALHVSDLTRKHDRAGNLVLLGEIENRARAPYGEVQVTVTLLNKEREPIGDVSTYVDSAMIEPGERLPFQIWTEYQGDFDDYEVTVQSRPSPRFFRPDVSVDSVTGAWASTKRYDVSGSIRNNTDQPIEYLQFVVALYNQDGRIVDYMWGMIDPVVLEPGEETTFETFFFGPDRFSEYRAFISH